MQLDLDNLPSDPALLHRLVRDIALLIEHRNSEIERLRLIIKQLQRAQYGRRSERLDADQFALGFEDLDTDLAVAESKPDAFAAAASSPSAPPKRKSLPDHLPREETVLGAGSEVCGCCGGALHAIGESVSEMLDWVPAQLRVLRICRPKFACRACGTVTQAPAPERPIGGGLATPALLAQVLVSKYCDHTPLYRQAQILARHGVELERSTPAGWVGAPAGGSKLCTNDSAKRVRLRSSFCRRHANPGAGSRPRTDENRTLVGLCARPARLGWTGAAGSSLSVRAGSKSRATRLASRAF